MVCKLSVNLNAVALLRNRRDLPWPSVTALGRIALKAGAYGLTVHPRPDERHTRRSDVFDLKALVAEYPGKELNIEGFPDDRLMVLVLEACPDQVTFVPDDPAQATSDHGWDFEGQADFLKARIGQLKEAGLRVSLFADPSPDGLAAAALTGADRVEFYTGPYGACHDAPRKAERELRTLIAAAEAARAAGLAMNAGHDLTLSNLPPLVAAIPDLAEVSIGHGLTADCLTYGMAETVRRYRAACGDPVTE